MKFATGRHREKKKKCLFTSTLGFHLPSSTKDDQNAPPPPPSHSTSHFLPLLPSLPSKASSRLLSSMTSGMSDDDSER